MCGVLYFRAADSRTGHLSVNFSTCPIKRSYCSGHNSVPIHMNLHMSTYVALFETSCCI